MIFLLSTLHEDQRKGGGGSEEKAVRRGVRPGPTPGISPSVATKPREHWARVTTPSLKRGWPHHAYSLHTAAGRTAQNNAEYTAAQTTGIEDPFSKAKWFLPCPPPPPQQMEPSLSVGDFPPPPLRSSSTPTHSPPPCPVLFCWLRYKVDFLVLSFIFSWERFWRPRKKRLPPPPSRSILHLLLGLLGTASRHRPQPWVAEAARSSAH